MTAVFRAGILLGCLLAGASLSGCASLASAFEEDFECPVQDGLSCASIRTIQDAIVQPGVQVGPRLPVAGPVPGVSNTTAPGVPLWRPGTVMEIHVAGFVDADNLLHADSVVYAVLDPGGWAAERRTDSEGRGSGGTGD